MDLQNHWHCMIFPLKGNLAGWRHCTILGLSSTATSWFRSYLFYRSQITRVLDSYFFPRLPSSGVPQGSILGPTLFSAFINDLPPVLPLNSSALFAVDTTTFIVGDNICSLQSSLQTCLNLANLWLQRNGLKFNTLKTKSMLIHSSRKITGSTLELIYQLRIRVKECSTSLIAYDVITGGSLIRWKDRRTKVLAFSWLGLAKWFTSTHLAFIDWSRYGLRSPRSRPAKGDSPTWATRM